MTIYIQGSILAWDTSASLVRRTNDAWLQLILENELPLTTQTDMIINQYFMKVRPLAVKNEAEPPCYEASSLKSMKCVTN